MSGERLPVRLYNGLHGVLASLGRMPRDYRESLAELHESARKAVGFDDFGATLHVCGTADGLEHLRFDCFEDEPHYHYIENAAGANTIVRIDELAVGDPIEFSLGCVEHHLADMLRNCGVPELADQVAADPEPIRKALEEVRDLMTKARQPVA